jgi:hypothetical protein
MGTRRLLGTTPIRTSRSASPRPDASANGIDRKKEILSGSRQQRDVVRRVEEGAPVTRLANALDVDGFIRIVGTWRQPPDYAQAPGREQNDSAQDLAIAQILVGGHDGIVENHATRSCSKEKVAVLARVHEFQADSSLP